MLDRRLSHWSTLTQRKSTSQNPRRGPYRCHDDSVRDLSASKVSLAPVTLACLGGLMRARTPPHQPMRRWCDSCRLLQLIQVAGPPSKRTVTRPWWWGAQTRRGAAWVSPLLGHTIGHTIASYIMCFLGSPHMVSRSWAGHQSYWWCTPASHP